MAVPGPTTQRNTERYAANLLRLTRAKRGWSQRQLAEAAGVPTSTIGKIESGTRQPSLPTLCRLVAAADLDLRFRLDAYDDHDDVLDARRARMTDEQRATADARHERVLAALDTARESAVP